MVSYTLFPNVNIDDPIWTLVAMQWGQIITHDMGLIEGSTQSSKSKLFHSFLKIPDNLRIYMIKFSNSLIYSF